MRLNYLCFDWPQQFQRFLVPIRTLYIGERSNLLEFRFSRILERSREIRCNIGSVRIEWGKWRYCQFQTR